MKILMKIMLALLVGGMSTMMGLFVLGLMIQTPPPPPQDPQALVVVADAVRQRGFVCDRGELFKSVGMTERGEQYRFICNDFTLTYRITMSPDRQRMSIRPWSE